MKKDHLLLFLVILILFVDCEYQDGQNLSDGSAYVLHISGPLAGNAPALQSFVLGKVTDTEWILFGGRATQDSGGLHKMMGCDYAYGAFPSHSFNTNIYYYRLDTVHPEQSLLDSLSVSELIDLYKEVCSPIICNSLISNIHDMFVHTNAMYYQEANYLYLIGGFGPTADSGQHFDTPQTHQMGVRYEYRTRRQFFRMDLSLMAQLIKNKKLDNLEGYLTLFKLALKVPPTLTCTGGELFKLPGTNTFYLVGGHNYQEIDSVFGRTISPEGLALCDSISTPFMQRYANAAYAFEMKDTIAATAFALRVTQVISDKSKELLSAIAGFTFANGHYEPCARAFIDMVDSSTIFRRRDAPVTPSLYRTANGALKPAMVTYGGVFRYFGITPNKPKGTDKDSVTRANVYYPLPWTDALFFMPDSDVPYAVDPYQQAAPQDLQNYNLYDCSRFVMYSENEDMIYTYLLGGIGGGGKLPTSPTDTQQVSDKTMAFTNSAILIKKRVPKEDSIQSVSEVSMLDTNCFHQKEYYGAEAVFIRNSTLPVVSDNPEIINLDLLKEPTVVLGYIYGGIKAYSLNPGGKTGSADSTATGYGKMQSVPTNALWKVYLTKAK